MAIGGGKDRRGECPRNGARAPQGRCDRGRVHTSGPSCTECDTNDPYRHGACGRSGGDRSRVEPRTARRQHYGFTNMVAELSGKRLELLRELVPSLAHVGLLIQGTDPWDKTFVEESQAAAARAGIQLHVARVARPEDLEAAFTAITKERAGALVFSGSLPVPLRQVAQLALRYRLLSVSHLNDFADSGGLMSYGANLIEIQR